MEVFQIGAYIAAIFTALGSLFVFAVIRPFNKSNDDLRDMIKELRELITELRVDLKSSNERVHRLEGEVRELHHAVQKAHDRLDALPKMVTAHEKA